MAWWDTRHGVSISAEVASTLEEISGSVSKVGGLVGEIAAASREQSQGIAQVTTAMGHRWIGSRGPTRATRRNPLRRRRNWPARPGKCGASFKISWYW